MATSIEFVRSHALPRPLVLRVATGRAIDALVVYRATNRLSPEQRKWLDQASKLLRLSSEQEPLRAGRSIGEYRKDIGLISAAKRAWGTRKASALTTKLTNASDRLTELAAGTDLSADETDDLIATLRAFRDAITPAGPTFTERVGRNRFRG